MGGRKERIGMRKIFLVGIVLLFTLACNLSNAPKTLSTLPPDATVPATENQTALPDNPTVVPQAPTEVATAVSGPTIAEIVPVPASDITIGGEAYTAYQVPGDPFRFVCPAQCPLDKQYIYAEYAGFRLAHARLLELTGIDTLSELQPVDMHLDLTDSICRSNPYGHAYIYTDKHQAYTCSEGPGYYPSVEEIIRNAARLDGQYFPLHEFMHTFFFGRLSGKAGSFEDYKAPFFHDFVVPVPSYAIGLLDPVVFCSYRDLPPGDYNGFLINELCKQNGFDLAELKSSLVALDKLYLSGGGQVPQAGFLHPAATIAQYRDILNGQTGGDTTPAFAAACWPAQLFGNAYSPAPGCAVIDTSATATTVK